jgi:hypothetical protein
MCYGNQNMICGKRHLPFGTRVGEASIMTAIDGLVDGNNIKAYPLGRVWRNRARVAYRRKVDALVRNAPMHIGAEEAAETVERRLGQQAGERAQP